MPEKAILPLNRARITAGYKNPAYKTEMGFTHYGVDMADYDRTVLDVYAPFKFKVTHCGADTLMGNTIIGVSVDTVNVHNGVKVGDRRLVVRMAHLASINVKVGDIVMPEGLPIGKYGSTGTYGGNPHLHIEMDSDIAYPNYSPTLSGSSNIWKAGSDSTIHPMDVLKVDVAGARGFAQKFYYALASGDWVRADDITTLTYDGATIVAKGI